MLKQNCISSDELQPRQVPRPSPCIQVPLTPAVPEVSLIFDETNGKRKWNFNNHFQAPIASASQQTEPRWENNFHQVQQNVASDFLKIRDINTYNTPYFKPSPRSALPPVSEDLVRDFSPQLHTQPLSRISTSEHNSPHDGNVLRTASYAVPIAKRVPSQFVNKTGDAFFEPVFSRSSHGINTNANNSEIQIRGRSSNHKIQSQLPLSSEATVSSGSPRSGSCNSFAPYSTVQSSNKTNSIQGKSLPCAGSNRPSSKTGTAKQSKNVSRASTKPKEIPPSTGSSYQIPSSTISNGKTLQPKINIQPSLSRAIGKSSTNKGLPKNLNPPSSYFCTTSDTSNAPNKLSDCNKSGTRMSKPLSVSARSSNFPEKNKPSNIYSGIPADICNMPINKPRVAYPQLISHGAESQAVTGEQLSANIKTLSGSNGGHFFQATNAFCASQSDTKLPKGGGILRRSGQISPSAFERAQRFVEQDLQQDFNFPLQRPKNVSFLPPDEPRKPIYTPTPVLASDMNTAAAGIQNKENSPPVCNKVYNTSDVCSNMQSPEFVSAPSQVPYAINSSPTYKVTNQNYPEHFELVTSVSEHAQGQATIHQGAVPNPCLVPSSEVATPTPAKLATEEKGTCVPVEKCSTVTEKDNTTELYKIIQAQNDQLKVLQEQVQKLLLNQSQQQNSCVAVNDSGAVEQGTQTNDSVLDYVATEEKITIGIMTSFLWPPQKSNSEVQTSMALVQKTQRSTGWNKTFEDDHPRCCGNRILQASKPKPKRKPIHQHVPCTNCCPVKPAPTVCHNCCGQKRQSSAEVIRRQQTVQSKRNKPVLSVKRPVANSPKKCRCMECKRHARQQDTRTLASSGSTTEECSSEEKASDSNDVDNDQNEVTFTLCDFNLPTIPDEPGSPTTSVHIDMQDYEDSDESSSVGSSSPRDSPILGDSASNCNHDDSSGNGRQRRWNKVNHRNQCLPAERGREPDDEVMDETKIKEQGWTFYNNILGRMNKFLQTSVDSPSKDERATRTSRRQDVQETIRDPVEAARIATLEHFRKIGINFDYDRSNLLQQTFARRRQYDPMFEYKRERMPLENDRKINELALKYLRDEQLSELATLVAAAQARNAPSGDTKEVAFHETTSNPKDPSDKAPYGFGGNNLSFATIQYLEKYKLLPAYRPKTVTPVQRKSAAAKTPIAQQDNQINRRERIAESDPSNIVSSEQCCKGCKSSKLDRHSNSPINNLAKKHGKGIMHKQGKDDQTRPSTTKILDITSLKQQPKLL